MVNRKLFAYPDYEITVKLVGNKKAIIVFIKAETIDANVDSVAK